MDGIELVIGLFIGIIVGAIILILYYSRRMEDVAQQRFQVMRGQLEQSIRQENQAKLAEWQQRELRTAVAAAREDALQRSRVTLKGKIGEQLAPLLSEFISRFNPSEARFIGTPIDYLIFRNLSKVETTADPIEIFLVDVKTGEATLSKAERMVRDAVERGAVHFETMRLHDPETPEPVLGDILNNSEKARATNSGQRRLTDTGG